MKKKLVDEEIAKRNTGTQRIVSDIHQNRSRNTHPIFIIFQFYRENIPSGSFKIDKLHPQEG
jgi:hypothetical protein